MTVEPRSPAPAVSSPSSDGEARQFSQIWADSLTQVLGQIAGVPLPVENLAEMPAEVTGPNANDMQVIVMAAGALRGEMSLRIPPASARSMAQLFLGEAQDAAVELQKGHPEALEELLRQVAGYVASTVKPIWGEVQFQVQAGSSVSWAVASSGWLGSTSATPCRVLVEWKVSAALHAALVAAAQPKAGVSATVPSPAIPSPLSGTGVDSNFDLLMDVSLEVVLRFGECNLLLREILDLGAGSVVELDRKVGEPADLLLDGRVVARGEVVVVNGDYGLRVLEVVAPAMALRSAD